MDLLVIAAMLLVPLLIFVGFIWLAAAIRRRLGGHERTASEERAIAEARMYMYNDFNDHHFN